jgi:hypothetical protein
LHSGQSDQNNKDNKCVRFSFENVLFLFEFECYEFLSSANSTNPSMNALQVPSGGKRILKRITDHGHFFQIIGKAIIRAVVIIRIITVLTLA